MDCFAPLAMTPKRAFTTPRRDAPELCMNLPPYKTEGVGNAGCPLHPQPRVHFALVKKHTSKRAHRNHPAFPHAMVLRLISCSPVTGLVCHRRQRIWLFLNREGGTFPPETLPPAGGR